MVGELPTLSDLSHVCDACMMGKHQRSAIPKESQNRTKSPLQLIHIDLSGKMVTPAMGGSLYYMLVVDDFSRNMWVYFLREKAEAFKIFKRWHKFVERESGKFVIEVENSYQQNSVSIAMSMELSASLQLPTPHNKMALLNVRIEQLLRRLGVC